MSVIDERKIRYYTNPEKKIITAVYRDSGADIINLMQKKGLHILDFSDGFYNLDGPRTILVETKTYQATARCAEGDKYDEELGKFIAKTKLECKIANDRDKRLKRYLKCTFKACLMLADEAEKMKTANNLYIRNQIDYATKKIKENCNG